MEVMQLDDLKEVEAVAERFTTFRIMPLPAQVVILQIGSGTGLHKSFRTSVFDGVHTDEIGRLCPHLVEELIPHAVNGKLHIWACTDYAGTTIYSDVSMSGNAKVLFVYKGNCIAIAFLTHVFPSRSLAKALWGNFSDTPEDYCRFLVLRSPCQSRFPLTSITELCADEIRKIVMSYEIVRKITNIQKIEQFLVGESDCDDIEIEGDDPPHTGYPPLENPDKELGDAGEKWVVDLLKQKAHEAGRPELAGQVELVASENLGYDIRWINPETDRTEHIEVKTTRGGLNAIFYISKNERDHLLSDGAPAYIYRVYDFERNPRYAIWTATDFEGFESTPIHYRVTL